MPTKRSQSHRNLKSAQQLCGPLDRLVIFLGDLSLGSFLSHYLLSFKSFRLLELGMSSFFTPVANGLNIPVESVIYLPMAFFMAQMMIFFSTLLLGASPFALVAGASNSGVWWWQRLGGAARTLVDLLLGPFLIFDLPVLVKKPSLKEMVLGSYLVVNRSGSHLRVLIILPFFIIFTILAPLMKDLEFVKGFVVSNDIIKPVGIESGADFSSFKELKSELFHFKSLTSLGKGRFVLLPDYDALRVRKKKKLSPNLVIYDKELMTAGELQIKRKISLLSLLKLAKRGNPFFGISFPLLSKAIDENEKNIDLYKERDAKALESLPMLFSDGLKAEIKKFFEVSFELGLGNIVAHTLNYGPFLRGFVEVRQGLLSLIPQGVSPEVDIVEVGKSQFLRFRQSFPKSFNREKHTLETYMPIETQNSFVLEMAWSGDLQGALSAKAFRENVLAPAEWFFDYENIFANRIQEAVKSSALALLDVMVEKELDQRNQDLFEQALYQFYYHLVRKAISEEDDHFYKVLFNNYQKVSAFLEYKNSGKRKAYSSQFMEAWGNLWKVLRLKNTPFFDDENDDYRKKN